jgi:hypothetical protein
VAHLVWTFGGRDHVVQLKKFHRIGRHPSNDIQVLDKLVSKEHAQIEKKDDQWLIRDLGSLNGTFVNASRVSAEQPLEHQDEIAIGSAIFVFSDVHDAFERAGEVPAHSQVFRGRHRRNEPVAREETMVSDAPRSPISVRVPRDVERSIVIHQKLESALRDALSVTGREALVAKALDDVVDLLAADWGASFLWPFEAEARPFSVAARGGPAPAEIHFDPNLAHTALSSGRSASRVQPMYSYRVWQPVCQVAVPLARAGTTHALLWVERRGNDEGLPFEQTDLLAKVVGALIG